jgi:putative transposase
MNISDVKRLKELETENTRLKKLLAESMLESEITKEALRKKW